MSSIYIMLPQPPAGVLDFLPLWGVFIVAIVLSTVSFELAFVLTKKRAKDYKDRDTGPVGSAVAAILGLFAFILAFTFGFAASRFDERRSYVVQEANAIGTTFLRADFLPTEYRSRIKDLLYTYLDLRLTCVEEARVIECLPEVEKIQQELWKITVEVAKSQGSTPIMALFAESLNQVIDLHTIRMVWGIQVRIPPVLWGIFAIISVLSMLALGFQAGIGKTKNSFAQLIVATAFSLIITLIADLDRTQQGFLTTNQLPLQQLRTTLKQQLQSEK